MARGSRQPLRRAGAAPQRASAGTRLAQVTRFASELGQAPWFAALGTPLTNPERDIVTRYLSGLGLAPAALETVRGWSEAGATALRQDWDRAWWAAEERQGARLQDQAAAEYGNPALLAALSAVTEAAAALHARAIGAAAAAGVADPMLMRVAAGAAALACHHRGLTLAAGAAETHPFALKYRLFAQGRWLLGVYGGGCFIF